MSMIRNLALGAAVSVLAAPAAALADSNYAQVLQSVELGFSTYSGSGPVAGDDVSGPNLRGGYALSDSIAVRAGYESLSDDAATNLDLAHLGLFYALDSPFHDHIFYAGVTAEYVDFDFEEKTLVGQSPITGDRIYQTVSYDDNEVGVGVRAGTSESVTDRLRLVSEVAWVFVDNYDYYNIGIGGYYDVHGIEGLDLFARGHVFDGNLGFALGTAYNF